MTNDLSLDEKVLLAANDLVKSSKGPFTAEDLVIAAWQKFPGAFGLEGYGDQYPDSNRVFTKIMGTEGLRGRGWLLKVGEKLYDLSEAGRLHAEAIGDRKDDAVSRSSLDRRQREALQKLLQSKAVMRVRNEMFDEVIFMDACSFRDISSRSTANTLAARLAGVESLIERVSTLLHKDKSLAFVHGGFAITGGDLDVLKRTNAFLRERFRDELRIIADRKDDRKSR